MRSLETRVFDYLDDALAATIELNRVGVAERDILVITRTPKSVFERDRLNAPVEDGDGNRADGPLTVEPERVSDKDAARSTQELLDWGVSAREAKRLLDAVDAGQTLIIVSSDKPSANVAAVLDQFTRHTGSVRARDLSGTGWTSIPDDDFHSPAADNRTPIRH